MSACRPPPPDVRTLALIGLMLASVIVAGWMGLR